MMFAMHGANRSYSLLLPRSLASGRLWRVTFVVILAAWSVAVSAQRSTPSHANSRLAVAIDRALAEGHDAILPPHVSNLLGISPQEQEVPVKQFAEMGEPIRGFEVSTAVHNNVVIFVESRAQKESTFYLFSRFGALRKVLSVKEGVGHSRQPTPDDREAFEKEKRRWIDQLAPKVASPPA
jgi:hypothetical protein